MSITICLVFLHNINKILTVKLMKNEEIFRNLKSFLILNNYVERRKIFILSYNDREVIEPVRRII